MAALNAGSLGILVLLLLLKDVGFAVAVLVRKVNLLPLALPGLSVAICGQHNKRLVLTIMVVYYSVKMSLTGILPRVIQTLLFGPLFIATAVVAVVATIVFFLAFLRRVVRVLAGLRGKLVQTRCFALHSCKAARAALAPAAFAAAHVK
tara:strand:- start:3575 stop:4021 length:447 start_codon:yes stop_codon:yes gene_type:complete